MKLGGSGVPVWARKLVMTRFHWPLTLAAERPATWSSLTFWSWGLNTPTVDAPPLALGRACEPKSLSTRPGKPPPVVVVALVGALWVGPPMPVPPIPWPRSTRPALLTPLDTSVIGLRPLPAGGWSTMLMSLLAGSTADRSTDRSLTVVNLGSVMATLIGMLVVLIWCGRPPPGSAA